MEEGVSVVITFHKSSRAVVQKQIKDWFKQKNYIFSDHISDDKTEIALNNKGVYEKLTK